MPILDAMISAVRPLRLKGKGFLLDRVTAHEGIRHATVAGSYAMTLDLANVIHRQIYMGCFANAMTRWARALLGPRSIFLDVGAHAGYFSLIAADRVGPRGRVLAVEPNPVVFSELVAHLAANGVSTVEACNWGLADRHGSLELHVPQGTRLDYNATLLPRPGWAGVQIEARRLDDCLDAWSVERIDLMKIDVEGAEPRVLAGGVAPLTKGVVRHVMIEINGPRLVEAGSSPAALIDDLVGLGFSPARLARGRVVRADRADLDLDPTHECDRLFVHRAALQLAAGDEYRP